jgi:signal transduction histidine kinase
MLAGLNGAWRMGALHWVCLPAMAGFAGTVWLLRVRGRIHGEERLRDRRLREEIEAYARFDARLPQDGDVTALAEKVCRLVADKSAFYRVALLARDAAGRMFVAASVGMDDSRVEALHAWGVGVVDAERSGRAGLRGDGEIQVGMKSFAVVLGASEDRLGCGRAIVAPLWTMGGRMVGALAVCADTMMSVRRRALVEAVEPLEALAVKLGRTMENAALAERLLRAEKISGLGLLAGGMAHALNNPLTAVLGFAELIAETTEEARVQEDAETIVREALRMRETLERLLSFWRPAVQSDEGVALVALVRELEEACREKLVNRGVRLVVQAGEDVPAVRGSKDRLQQVMEHLLNNAAQAIASVPNKNKGLEHSIRVTVSHDARGVQVIVSDTGPGFREPGRAFDPFYTTRQPGEGAGLGLSICYGIVREHGGEISAFNLHPQGAAVVVELPIRQKNVEDFEMVTRQVA